MRCVWVLLFGVLVAVVLGTMPSIGLADREALLYELRPCTHVCLDHIIKVLGWLI